LAAIRAEARQFLGPLALTKGARQDLVLAVSEAASNAIEHAYTPAGAGNTVDLTLWTEPDTVCIEVVDHGWWHRPSNQPTGRGLGIPIMQRLVQSVLIHYDARGTRLLLSHPLPGVARTAPKECRPTSLQVEPPTAHGIERSPIGTEGTARPPCDALDVGEVSRRGYTWTVTDKSVGEPWTGTSATRVIDHEKPVSAQSPSPAVGLQEPRPRRRLSKLGAR
jgi:anti-sigma regulatory factor (Ser/Thr protein kinase)